MSFVRTGGAGPASPSPDPVSLFSTRADEFISPVCEPTVTLYTTHSHRCPSPDYELSKLDVPQGRSSINAE